MNRAMKTEYRDMKTELSLHVSVVEKYERTIPFEISYDFRTRPVCPFQRDVLIIRVVKFYGMEKCALIACINFAVLVFLDELGKLVFGALFNLSSHLCFNFSNYYRSTVSNTYKSCNFVTHVRRNWRRGSGRSEKSERRTSKKIQYKGEYNYLSLHSFKCWWNRKRSYSTEFNVILSVSWIYKHLGVDKISHCVLLIWQKIISILVIKVTLRWAIFAIMTTNLFISVGGIQNVVMCFNFHKRWLNCEPMWCVIIFCFVIFEFDITVNTTYDTWYLIFASDASVFNDIRRYI